QSAHARVRIRSAPLADAPSCSVPDNGAPDAPERALTAALHVGERGSATCWSDDSIRFFGSFGAEAELTVWAAGPVRVVVRAPGGKVLAGPVTVSRGQEAPPLAW